MFSQFRGLSLSKDQSVLLVGFVDKVGHLYSILSVFFHHNSINQPPQLWNIDGNSEESSAQTMLRLSPQCVYESKLKSYSKDFCHGRSFFYGNGDELVICWDYYSMWIPFTAVHVLAQGISFLMCRRWVPRLGPTIRSTFIYLRELGSRWFTSEYGCQSCT